MKQAITLLSSEPNRDGITWTDDETVLHRVRDFEQVVNAVQRRAHNFTPIERIIIEGSIDSLDFLMFLSTLPHDFDCDVMLIDQPDHAYLSAADWHGSRVMYDLDKADIDFYTHLNNLRPGDVDRAKLIREQLTSGVRHRRLRVLLADDDPKSRTILTRALNDLGCEVFTAQTGAEAVKIASELRPNVLLLDGLMPEMGGFEAARFIRHLDSSYRPRIVLATGVYKNTRYKNEAHREYGVDAYLVKPVTADQLAHALFGAASTAQTATAVA
jgi:CheY-like chemotaxis protein